MMTLEATLEFWVSQQWEFFDHKYGLSPVEIIAGKDSMLDEHWDMFENAATYSYARSSIEEKKKSGDEIDSVSKKTNLRYGFSIKKTLNRMFSFSFNYCSEESVPTMNGNGTPMGNKNQQETITDLKEELKSVRSTMVEMQTQLSQVLAQSGYNVQERKSEKWKRSNKNYASAVR
jgi:hypothetical protein